MSGDEQKWGCRIGKVTLKEAKPAPVLAKIKKKAKSRIRKMLAEAIEALDINADAGVQPLVGFFGIVHDDGTVDMNIRFNKTPTDKELQRLNWRNMTMLFEDAAQDCRNHTLYHQQTTYDLVNQFEED